MESEAFTTLRTVRMKNVTKTSGRELSTNLWFAISVSITKVVPASSMCAGMPANMSRRRSSLLARDVRGAEEMFAGRSSEISRLAITRKDVTRSGSCSIGKRARSWACIPTRPVCHLFHWVLTRSTEEVFSLFNYESGCVTRYFGVAGWHRLLLGFCWWWLRFRTEEKTIFLLGK